MRTSKALNALNLAGNSDQRIHETFVDMFKSIIEADMSKKDIVESNELAAVLGHGQMGRDHMKRVITWVHKHTPIRIRRKDNGHFHKLGFAKKPVWNIEAMEAEKWWNCEAVKSDKVAKSSVERGIQALVREVAREAFETKAPGASVDKVREIITRDLMALVIEEMSSEKFSEWSDKRADNMLEAERKEKQADAEKSAEVKELVARLRSTTVGQPNTTIQ